MYSKLRVDHGQWVIAHAASAHRVINTVGTTTQYGADLLVGLDPVGVRVAGDPVGQRRCLHQTACQFECRDHIFKVLRVLKERRINQRCRLRVFAGQRYGSAAARTQQANVARQPMTQTQLARMVLHRSHDKMQLNIRFIQPFARFEKRSALGKIRGQHASTFPAKTAGFLEHSGAACK
ncbi:hypothetical protein D3C78_1287090 [compost metagenome]